MTQPLAQDAWLGEGRRLAERWAALSEGGMRAAQIAQHLRSNGPAEAVWTLEGVLRGALGKDDACALVACSLVDPDEVMSRVPPEHLQAMGEAGVGAGCVAAGLWLRSSVLHESLSDDVDAAHLVNRALRGLTLGERRALARKARGDRLDRLLADPDPVVIQNLLNNPRTTEATVLRICARRPTVSAPLETVLRTPRWRQRYRVRLALVKNPYLRLRFAVNLLVLLDRLDLEGAYTDESLSPLLRLGAQRLLDLVREP